MVIMAKEIEPKLKHAPRMRSKAYFFALFSLFLDKGGIQEKTKLVPEEFAKKTTWLNPYAMR